MSDILKFSCLAPNCGRKFSTQEALNTHFDLRHPELKQEKENKPSIEKIIKQISKPKLNPQEKHHFLQPITKRKSKAKIVTNNNTNKEIKEEKNKKEIIEEDIDTKNIPIYIEEKEKRLLNNLIQQINDIENYREKDCEFHKEFKLPEVPDYDTMYDSDDEKNNDKKENIDNIKKNKDYIYEINEEMIIKNTDGRDDEINHDNKYKQIHEINLSKKNIINFKNKKNVSFEKLQDLYILNLSENIISEANDIKYFENLRELYMNNNKLEDISFCEFLPNLTILNLENNNITSITSLNICIKLKILKLSSNNIKYLNSTLKIFKNLKNLEEVTIKQNPFLSELFSYREYFISNYKNIKKFDEEIITEEKRNKAEIFYKENNPIYKNITERPMSSRPGMNKLNKTNNDNNLYDIFEDNSDENSEEDPNNIMMAKTQTSFRNTDINNINNNHKINKDIKDEIKDNKNNEDKKVKKEEEKLKKIIAEQKNTLDKLKNELESSSVLNKEYEIQIDKYRNELNFQNIETMNNHDEETEKIRKELEMWKKQYFDLLEKNMDKEENKLKFSQDLFNGKNIKKENTTIKKDIIERPQTAQVRSNLVTDFKKLYEEINILEGNNDFKEVLDEETEEEDDEEKEKKDDNKEEEKEQEKEEDDKNIKENINIDDEIPDDEIEEMFRKSCQDLQKMRKDLQDMNNMNNNININKKNDIENILNENRIGNKPTLKPIIFKKENNKNSIVNQNFGKAGKKILPGSNKNLNEDNKIYPSQKYNDLLYKLKKNS